MEAKKPEIVKDIHTPTFVMRVATDELMPHMLEAMGEDDLPMDFCVDMIDEARECRKIQGVQNLDDETKSLARIGDIISVTGNLAKRRFFNKGHQVRDFVNAFNETEFDTGSIVKLVNNPEMYLGDDIIVRPDLVTSLLRIRGQAEDTIGDEDFKRSNGDMVLPSMHRIYTAAVDFGLDLHSDLSIDDIEELFSAYGLLNKPTEVSYTPRMYSDPMRDIRDPDRMGVGIHDMEFQGDRMSCELGWSVLDACEVFELGMEDVPEDLL